MSNSDSHSHMTIAHPLLVGWSGMPVERVGFPGPDETGTVVVNVVTEVGRLHTLGLAESRWDWDPDRDWDLDGGATGRCRFRKRMFRAPFASRSTTTAHRLD